MFERLSLADDSLIAGYAESIQRHEFALEWCNGRRVLDAGCGSGYGTHYFATHGAASVLGVDVAAGAIAEACRHYRHSRLSFEVRDLEALDDSAFHGRFDVVVNFETLPHLREPEKFLRGARAALAANGTLICSTPNGEVVETDGHGRPLYRYQHRTYSATQLESCLSAHFASVSLFGHWLTHEGLLRRRRAREDFEQLSEAYYNPMARAGRAFKRCLGKKCGSPPVYRGDADSYRGDFAIGRLAENGFGWPPTTLLAVCRIAG